jgi:hypothetical protein
VVSYEEAIDFAMFTIRDIMGEFQDSVFLRALEFSDREAVLELLRLGGEERLLEVRQLGFQSVRDRGGVQAGYLGGEAVAGFGQQG